MSLFPIFENHELVVHYDPVQGAYRAVVFGNTSANEYWFDAFKDEQVKLPPCSVGDEFWCIDWRGEPVCCRVSMLQQKADKSWKIRLTMPARGVFDLTLEEFNKQCFVTREAAVNSKDMVTK